MKESIKVASIQSSSAGIDGKEENIEKVINYIKEYGSDHDLLVFPELIIQGYVREVTNDFKVKYWEAAETIPGPTTDRIANAAKKTGCHVVFGIAERSNMPVSMYNSAVLVGPSGYIGKSRKMHLAMLEKNYFIPGTGSGVFNTSLGNIGIIICYDLFFPETSRIAALKGTELLVHIAAAMGGGKEGGVGSKEDKKRFFESSQITRAIENQVFYIGTDMVGSCYMGERYGYWKPMGLSKIINNYGEIIAESKEGIEEVITATIEKDTLFKGRSVYPLLADRNPKNYEIISEYQK